MGHKVETGHHDNQVGEHKPVDLECVSDTLDENDNGGPGSNLLGGLHVKAGLRIDFHGAVVFLVDSGGNIGIGFGQECSEDHDENRRASSEPEEGSPAMFGVGNDCSGENHTEQVADIVACLEES